MTYTTNDERSSEESDHEDASSDFTNGGSAAHTDTPQI